MKSPLRKYFGLKKQGLKQKTSPDVHPAPPKDFEKYIQDILGMKEKYEDLFVRGQGISSSAYDFSRAFEDMATFMSEAFGEVFDAEVGNLFNMLAKVQYEISKLLDLFAFHVSQTLVKPFNDMFEQIKNIESQKLEYDNKRMDMQVEKPKVKHRKGKSHSPYEQLKLDEETLLQSVQSILQSHYQDIVKQAARYHVAQRKFLSKALLSVNAIKPEVDQLAEHRNIDLTLSEDDVSPGMNDDMPRARQRDGSEHDSTASSPRNTMGKHSYSSGSSGDLEFIKTPPDSKSAPLSAAADEVYALPSPTGILTKPAAGTGTHKMGEFGFYTPKEYHSANIVQSYQLDHNFHRDNKQHVLGNSRARHQTKVSSHNYYDDDDDDDDDDGMLHVSVGKKRYSHSGPFFPSYTNNNKSPSRAMEGHGNTSPLYRSGPVSKSPIRMSNVVSSPQISELHKLPLPPDGLTTPPRSPSRVAFSAPLGRKVQVQEVSLKSGPASPLPLPPGITRSMSIPSSSIQVE